MSRHDDLARSVRAHGGVWDTQRAVTALRDAGHEFPDQRGAEKQARAVLRALARDGALDRLEQRRAVYRAPTRA